MKVASFCYVPPPTVGFSQVFWDNLNTFPPKHDLIVYSDHRWSNTSILLKANPEILRGRVFRSGPHAGKENPFALHNGLFLAGLKMCRERGVSHALYVEADCRVGRKDWDDVIFDEYFSLGRPCIVAGTLSVYNPSNYGIPAARKFEKLVKNPPAHGIPMGVYGFHSAATQAASCIFPNGALAIYDVAWMLQMFDVDNQVAQSEENTAFDMALGHRIFDLFSEDAYEVVGSLGSVYSGYGNVLTTPEVRRELLTSGKVVAMHQEKTGWAP